MRQAIRSMMIFCGELGNKRGVYLIAQRNGRITFRPTDHGAESFE
jgi:hypothetical protein